MYRDTSRNGLALGSANGSNLRRRRFTFKLEKGVHGKLATYISFRNGKNKRRMARAGCEQKLCKNTNFMEHEAMSLTEHTIAANAIMLFTETVEGIMKTLTPGIC